MLLPFKNNYYCSVTFVLLFSPLLTPTRSPLQLPQLIPTIVCAHESSVHVLRLPLSLVIPLPPFLWSSISLFFISKFLVLFCSLVCFVDYVPFIGEIIWYLSFTAWLTSFTSAKCFPLKIFFHTEETKKN